MLDFNYKELDNSQIIEAISCLQNELITREKKNSRFEKAELSKKYKRDLRCPICKRKLNKDGHRSDGVRQYKCLNCKKVFSDSSLLSLSSSKLTLSKIKEIVTLIVMDCPDWVIAYITNVNIKTIQFWVDRCLDSAVSWAKEAKLKDHFWFDEMRFAPTRASGLEDGIWTTYGGRIAKDAYMLIAFDYDNGFCKVFYEKLGTPTSNMIKTSFSNRVEKGSIATHDGAHFHLQMIEENNLIDDCHKYIKGSKSYERSMNFMNSCCSYIRHAFESHNGIKYGKLEAYANWFLYRWIHMRKYGLQDSINYLLSRMYGTKKSHKFDDYGEKGEIWSRK